MHRLVKPINVLLDWVTASRHHAFNFLVLAQLLDDIARLHGEFTRWHKH